MFLARCLAPNLCHTTSSRLAGNYNSACEGLESLGIEEQVKVRLVIARSMLQMHCSFSGVLECWGR